LGRCGRPPPKLFFLTSGSFRCSRYYRLILRLPCLSSGRPRAISTFDPSDNSSMAFGKLSVTVFRPDSSPPTVFGFFFLSGIPAFFLTRWNGLSEKDMTPPSDFGEWNVPPLLRNSPNPQRGMAPEFPLSPWSRASLLRDTFPTVSYVDK